MFGKTSIQKVVIDNFSSLKLSIVVPPLILLFGLFCFFFIVDHDDLTINYYVNFQKDLFLFLNKHLSKFNHLEYNLTQLGDALIAFPLLTIFIIYAPKLWEALITSALLSIIISAVLKRLFAVPRPAAMFDNDSFVIIGKTLTGKSSLPSGHSIATFILITSVLFAFMPQKRKNKMMWSVVVVAAGLFIAFTRVGVGAHYPFDVLIGSTIGFITTTIGIKICSTYNWLQGIGNKKFYPVHLVLLIIWIALLINKIMEDNLVIYYISILALLVTLSLIIRSYVKKN